MEASLSSESSPSSSTLQRAGAVAVATAVDMVIDYPLWVVGKRIAAGCVPFSGKSSQ